MPTQRALAVAGELVAGGVGVHETALASPEVIDLGGRVVLPGFTDAHVHFPTWAMAQHEIDLDGCARSTRRSRASARRRSRRARAGCAATAGAAATGSRSGSRRGRIWTQVTGDAPAAMIAKDYHSLWLNTAALARAGGDLEVDGGVVERDADGEPTGVLREEAAWRFKERHMVVADEDYLEAMRTGVRLANARGVTAVHDKDGWLGALRLWQQLEERQQLSLRVWQSIPHDRLDEAAAVGLRSGFGSSFVRLGYLKVFMDGTLGSQTAWMLDGSGVQITSGAELAEIVRRGAEAGFPVAVHAIGDRANREALDAFEQTRTPGSRAGCASASSMPSCSRPRISPASPDLGIAVLGAVLARAVGSRSRRPVLGREDGRRLCVPIAAATPARSSQTAATRRSRSSTRSPASGPECAARSTAGRHGIPTRR